MITRKLPALIFLIALGGASLVAAAACDTTAPDHDSYLKQSGVDLEHILPPPPALDSAAGKADLEAVLDAQRTRTPAEAASAEADAELSVFRFADVMGLGFTPANLPFTATFFKHVSRDEKPAIMAAKAYFNRPRPFAADPEIKPIVHEPANASYPSGHAAFAYIDAIILAYMVPEKASAIFGRAALFAHNRVVAGVHYPSDLDAGRICGSVIDNTLFHDPCFMKDFVKARAEVRHAIGLH